MLHRQIQEMNDKFTLDSVKIYDISSNDIITSISPPVINWELYEPSSYDYGYDHDKYNNISKSTERIYGKYDTYNPILEDRKPHMMLDNNNVNDIDAFPVVFTDDIDNIDNKDENIIDTQNKETKPYMIAYISKEEHNHNMYVSQTKTGGSYYTTS